ncbi:MAG: IS21 family transposase [Elusimicrobiota bacterium]|nr:IS21 family transposase [Elusimicrobiota bacterium]
MSNVRLSMRKIREVLKLHHSCNRNQHQIAQACGIARSTVADYLCRAETAGLSWPLPAELTETRLGEMLFPPTPASEDPPRPLPDFDWIRSEKIKHRKVNVTLDNLWEEYIAQHPDGYRYSTYCALYSEWLGKRSYCMRQEHQAGEKLFVDYADGLSIWNKANGEPIPTQFFLSVWGASCFTYAEASLSQTLPAWCGSHVRAFDYFGCAPRILVPDNLKSAVIKPSLYEPVLNPTYVNLAEHYGGAVIPARSGHPKDKAKVENGVLVAKRWILARLRNRTFFSLAELNAAIWELLEALNSRTMKAVKKSRRELFEELDRPAALALPATSYEYAEWYSARVQNDYRIKADESFYTVPCRLVGEKVDIRMTENAVEVLCGGAVVAVHQRSRVAGSFIRNEAHLPPPHRAYLEWTPERIFEWGAKTGPNTERLLKLVIAGKAHPEQGYKACFGILRFGKSCGYDRLEAAAGRALRFHNYSYHAVKEILAKNLDKLDPSDPPAQNVLPFHENIRGGQYYDSSDRRTNAE